MAVPKTAALPLGYAPMIACVEFSGLIFSVMEKHNRGIACAIERPRLSVVQPERRLSLSLLSPDREFVSGRVERNGTACRPGKKRSA